MAVDGIWVNERAVLQCKSAVESSIKELLATADSMKYGIDHLTSICSGAQFDAIKTEVDKNVAALHSQVSDLRSRVVSKLNDVLAWIHRAKTTM